MLYVLKHNLFSTLKSTCVTVRLTFIAKGEIKVLIHYLTFYDVITP